MSSEQLKKLSIFRKEHFVNGSAPDTKTLKKAIDDGRLPGKIVAGRYFIDMTKYNKTTGNTLVDRILQT